MLLFPFRSSQLFLSTWKRRNCHTMKILICPVWSCSCTNMRNWWSMHHLLLNLLESSEGNFGSQNHMARLFLLSPPPSNNLECKLVPDRATKKKISMSWKSSKQEEFQKLLFSHRSLLNFVHQHPWSVPSVLQCYNPGEEVRKIGTFCYFFLSLADNFCVGNY